MPFYLSIAFKNIFRDRRRSFTLGINYFFIAILLLLVFSITNGIKKNVTDNVIASTAGHITISGEYIVKGKTYQGIKGFGNITEIVREEFPKARILARYTLFASVYYKGISKRLGFTGIDPLVDTGLRDQLTITDGTWDAFVNQPNAVVMPKATVDYFGLKRTDDLLLAARTRLGAFNTGTIALTAIATTGNYFLRDAVVCHFKFLQSLDLADSTTASKMYLFFEDIKGTSARRDLLLQKLNDAGYVAIKPANTNDALNAVAAASPRYKVLGDSVNQIRLTLSTADEVTGIVSQAIAAINGIGLFIAAIMLFIISISIFINMRMTINDRLQEIGTLRAIGTEQKDVVALFIFENVFLSILFVCARLVAGLLVMGIFGNFVTLPSDGNLGLLLDKGHFVFRPTIGAMAFILVVLVFFTALFSYFPARYGGRIPAVVALNKIN